MTATANMLTLKPHSHPFRCVTIVHLFNRYKAKKQKKKKEWKRKTPSLQWLSVWHASLHNTQSTRYTINIVIKWNLAVQDIGEGALRASIYANAVKSLFTHNNIYRVDLPLAIFFPYSVISFSQPTLHCRPLLSQLQLYLINRKTTDSVWC